VPCACIKLPTRFRDAEDAVKSRDGYNYDGYTLKVEFPRNNNGMRGGRGGGGGGGMGGDRGGRSGPPSRRSDFRAIITGLFSYFCNLANLFMLFFG